MNQLRNQFLLDPEIHFLNHGSFGACPRPVFEAYQAWQRELERQPVRFIQHDLTEYLHSAREKLADFIGADKRNVVFVPNPTFAVNTVARSLPLREGDELLTSDHEYGACLNAWQFMSQKRNFQIVKQSLPFPPKSREKVVEQFWAGVTPRTKLIFLSHITSQTAWTLPVEEICARARNAGILTFIDGAHAPGQLELDLADIDPDFYTGTCHKWLCAPKGSAFLYVRQSNQQMIEPLVVGWGWGEERQMRFGSDFEDNHHWLGTADLSAYLTVPTAIEFQQTHNWLEVRKRCHRLAREAVCRIAEVTGKQIIYEDDAFYVQMGLAELPNVEDLPAFKEQLYQQYRIEIPCIAWNNHQFIRVSIQAYNGEDNIRALVTALDRLLNAEET